MAATVRFEGLAELQEALRNLPEELRAEAAHIVQGSANAAVVAIKGEYGQHRFTGNLQDHVTITEESAGPFGVKYVVKSTARHAWLFERGSKLRHYITHNGKKHDTGKMWGRGSPPYTVARNASRIRRRMWQELKEMLVRHGATLSGDLP